MPFRKCDATRFGILSNLTNDSDLINGDSVDFSAEKVYRLSCVSVKLGEAFVIFYTSKITSLY